MARSTDKRKRDDEGKREERKRVSSELTKECSILKDWK